MNIGALGAYDLDLGAQSVDRSGPEPEIVGDGVGGMRGVRGSTFLGRPKFGVGNAIARSGNGRSADQGLAISLPATDESNVGVRRTVRTLRMAPGGRITRRSGPGRRG